MKCQIKNLICFIALSLPLLIFGIPDGPATVFRNGMNRLHEMHPFWDGFTPPGCSTTYRDSTADGFITDSLVCADACGEGSHLSLRIAYGCRNGDCTEMNNAPVLQCIVSGCNDDCTTEEHCSCPRTMEIE